MWAFLEDPSEDGRSQPVLRAIGGLFGTHDVGERGHGNVHPEDLEVSSLSSDVVVPIGSRRNDRDIEVPSLVVKLQTRPLASEPAS